MRVKVLLLVGLLAVSGCGGGPKLVPFTGKVVVEGRTQPISGDAVIALVPVEGLGKERLQGMINPDGAFKLTTYPHGDGVMPGKYKILIQFNGGKVFEQYTAANTTPLTVDVPDSGLMDYEIKLVPKK